jgi:hypothetical protein
VAEREGSLGHCRESRLPNYGFRTKLQSVCVPPRRTLYRLSKELQPGVLLPAASTPREHMRRARFGPYPTTQVATSTRCRWRAHLHIRACRQHLAGQFIAGPEQIAMQRQQPITAVVRRCLILASGRLVRAAMGQGGGSSSRGRPAEVTHAGRLPGARGAGAVSPPTARHPTRAAPWDATSLRSWRSRPGGRRWPRGRAPRTTIADVVRGFCIAQRTKTGQHATHCVTNTITLACVGTHSMRCPSFRTGDAPC